MTDNSKQTRRTFLKNAGIIGAAVAAMIVFLRNIFAFVYPKSKPKTFHKYLVAKEHEIPPGASKRMLLGREPIFVVHLESGYRVFSGVCTHLGCMVRWEPGKDRFYCPCHKGIFDKSGEVLDGPPPRPLDQFKVEVDDGLVFIYVEEKMRSPWT